MMDSVVNNFNSIYVMDGVLGERHVPIDNN